MGVKFEKIINIPESVRYYFNNRHSIQSIEKVDTPPPSFAFQEVQDFFKVKNNLAICKIELFQFMCEVFDKVWTEAVKAEGFEAVRWGEYVESNDKNYWYHPDITWDTANLNCILWVFKKESRWLCVGCYLDSYEKNYIICLELYFRNGNDWIAYSDLRDKLCDAWLGNTDYPTACHIKNTTDCPILQGNTIDVSRLAKRAREAVSALMKN